MGDPTGPGDRLRALGDELVEIHTGLRAELERLRADVDAHLNGRAGRPRQLKAHCLAFCSALTRHHTGEDTGAFLHLARRFPDLRPVIVKLEEDHRLVSGLLHDLERLLDGIPDEPDEAEARRVMGELDGLAAILESHFSFEERRILDALDALPPEAGTTESLLGLPARPDG
ncbi:hemerythrin domain-containing protein [Streptomyces sp. TRM43335]|uniref:Hemerythrin domain-containing protein n=1 Tax=Streptomyces taklimakanensis TaxID=2569853 RepID=A0A6G2BHQ6_9ACTN|nr:hemerythrin domain-containing protein [Streptomyces taklimakanensis]MTE21656.1 hemerythrin domain-containing protein [Streptomyces taklimakanensis]